MAFSTKLDHCLKDYCCTTICCPLICCVCCIDHCCCDDCFRNFISNSHCRLGANGNVKDYRILMLGLSGVGKTTILYQMKLHEIVATKPTIGFNVESIQHKNNNCTLWDIGGSKQIWDLWRHYYQNTECVIWVTDGSTIHNININNIKQCHMLMKGYLKSIEEISNKHTPQCIIDLCVHYLYEDKLNEKQLLHNTINNSELNDNANLLLILVNKSDLLSTELENETIIDHLELNTIENYEWGIVQCCGTTGDGLDKGLDWITQHLVQGTSGNDNKYWVKLKSVFSAALCF
eukprot:91956_1